MTNKTISAYLEVLEVAKKEIAASQSQTQIIGVFKFDAARQKAYLAEAARLLDAEVVDTPETHPEPAP